jgi:hypothetical protein
MLMVEDDIISWSEHWLYVDQVNPYHHAHLDIIPRWQLRWLSQVTR